MEKPLAEFERRSTPIPLISNSTPTAWWRPYLDDVFPAPPLMLRDPLDRTRAHLFKKLMDECIHPARIVFTFATAHRGALASVTQEQPDVQLAKMPLQRQAEYKRAAVEEGIASPKGREATKSFEKLIKWIHESTERGPRLAGPDYSLADIAANPLYGAT